jgi:asparagine synthase (glutamine-hydrolysing)
MWHLEKPKINAIQNWQLAKFTSRHVKVVLSGLGGDELFYGYNMHKILVWANRLSDMLPPSISRTIGGSLARTVSLTSPVTWSETERSLRVFQALGNWPRAYGIIRNIWDSPSMRQLIYGEKMLDSHLPDANAYIEENWPDDKDPVTAAARFEWREKLVNDLLWQEDRVSMAHGLEVRTPFVDSILYAHMTQFTRNELMLHGKPKSYMKQIVKDTLPREILSRPKSGFQIASHKFFHLDLKQLARKYLNEDSVRQYGLFNYDFIKHVNQFKPRKHLRWHYFILYFMLLTHIWLDVFETQSWRTTP